MFGCYGDNRWLSVCCYGDMLLWLRQVVHLDKLVSFSHVRCGCCYGDNRWLSVCCCGDVLLWLWQMIHLDWDKLDSFSHCLCVAMVMCCYGYGRWFTWTGTS